MPDRSEGGLKIAFYAPLKSPDHPDPSGDRRMARLLIRALEVSGHAVTLVSQLRSFSHQPDPARLAALTALAGVECERLLEEARRTGPPDLWLTYHPYYKSPDLIGPRVASALAIPYLTAEASYAGKRDRDAWQPWQAIVAAGLRQGDLHFTLTPGDRAGLAKLLGSEDHLLDLPPFLETASFEAATAKASGGPVHLVTVAMMRPGAKCESYCFLAETLAGLPDLDWHLTIIGDGEARPEIEAAFATCETSRIHWRGALPEEAVIAALFAADLYVWPGFDEAYGMAYLEAQAAGLPVLAFDSDGINAVVRDGETGILSPEGDLQAYRENLRQLIGLPATRSRLGVAGRQFVLGERSLAGAAKILDRGLAFAMQPR